MQGPAGDSRHECSEAGESLGMQGSYWMDALEGEHKDGGLGF